MNKPVVHIYRGIPGSGKTTAIKLLKDSLQLPDETDCAFSADDFWINHATGAYEFDPKRIGEAHAWCFRQFIEALECLEDFPQDSDEHPQHLFVDNTNIRAWEISPYVQAANAYGWDHEIVTVHCNPKIAHARNVHQVPLAVVWAMHVKLLTEELPPHWKQTITFGD